jgi:spore maturation protein CgeB
LGEGIEYTAFLSALLRLGHQVLHFESWNRIAHSNYAELNQSLYDIATVEKPDVLLAVQRDCEIWTETLDAIRELGHTATVAWTTDDSWKYREVSRFIGRHYDLITTTYDTAIPKYQKDGIDNVILTQWGANAEWLQDPLPAERCRHQVTFVGAAYGRRRTIVADLGQRGITVECFGDGWPHGPVEAHRIPEIIHDSVVSLNFSDGYKNKSQAQIKARVFEVPGAGGLLLTEHAPGIEQFYNVGSEILCYDDIDQMEAKLRSILEHPRERDAIAMAGHLRTKTDHTYDRRLAEVLECTLKASRDRKPMSGTIAFSNALARHKVNFALASTRSVLASACSLVFGTERGPRAARRAIFEISWRIFGERTFASAGLPGRLFPEI